ncbi:hypothetical protein CJ199_15705, partial [Brevibacterium paucivorans]
QVKNCSGDQPTPPPEGRTFKATGHGFSLQGDPVNPGKPNVFTAKVGEDAKLNYLTVRIKTDATFLDPTSLNYAGNANGFEESKKATNAFIDALAGTPAELGIYNFASTAP